MKKLAFLFLFFLLLPSKSYASTLPVITGNTTQANGSQAWGNANYATDVGFDLNTGNQNLLVCQVDMYMQNINNQTANTQMKIYKGGNSINTGTLITTSNAVSDFTLSASASSVISFYFGQAGGLGIGCQTLDANSHYWFDAVRVGTTTDYLYYVYGNGVTTPYTTKMYSKHSGIFDDYLSPFYKSLYGNVYGYGGSISTGSAQLAINLYAPYFDCGVFQPICDGLTNVLNFAIGLVVPQNVDTTQITALQTTLYTKAPFAYLNSIFSFNLTSPTGSSSALPVFSIPINPSVILANTQPITFNATIPENARGVFDWIRNLSTMLIWLSFIVFIVNLARRII